MRIWSWEWDGMGSKKSFLHILFDMFKAFDTVPHASLLNKLTSNFGIAGKFRSWIKAFLTNRTQSVKFIIILVGLLMSLVVRFKVQF